MIPLPDALHDLGADASDPTPPNRKSLALYAAHLVDGPFDDDDRGNDGRLQRESDAWLDVLRCLDTWAQRASATGVSSLGDVYDALQRDGNALLADYKRALQA